MRLAGDDLFRRMEGYKAWKLLDMLKMTIPRRAIWRQMIADLHTTLGGSTPAEWEAVAAAAASILDNTMEQLCRNFYSGLQMVSDPMLDRVLDMRGRFAGVAGRRDV